MQYTFMNKTKLRSFTTRHWKMSPIIGQQCLTFKTPLEKTFFIYTS